MEMAASHRLILGPAFVVISTAITLLTLHCCLPDDIADLVIIIIN